MDPYEATLLVIGVAALGAAWLPGVLEDRPLSPLIVLVGFGALVYGLPLGVDLPDPRVEQEALERLTELGVLVALLGAGLKLDRPVGLRGWMPTWRMLAVGMPLFIAGAAALAVPLLGLPLASAVLLAAVLAPTDPVLASDVQVGEPGSEGEDDVRFTLTSEAGLNDGLAFPFVYLAIGLAEAHRSGIALVGRWVAEDVLFRLVVALIVGYLAGRLLAMVLFRRPRARSPVADRSEGFVALAVVFLVYGLTEVLHGYGFLAVFVAAATLRAAERRHEVHRVLHNFAEQTERLLAAGLLVVFGGVLAQGMLAEVDEAIVGFAVVVLLVLRPVTGWLALARLPVDRVERGAIAFYGVRGVGSFYYLAYALSDHRFPGAPTLWAAVAVVVLGSLVLHGTSAGLAMSRLDDRRRRIRRRLSGPRAGRTRAR
ncbi:MAG: cation:proton antiporter [Acidimicrobiales bacterium]|jgi:NhaP-type Na+/H+ or K+/H+ antiporter|nr:cation:proton antiporter [Acidimicrobiales bacterium]